jgi:hypothetical protein
VRCNKVYAWNVQTGKRKKVSGKKTCDADSTSTGFGVPELAVAGKRFAWIVNWGGNTESEDYLYTSSWRRPKERKLASASRTGEDYESLAGNWIGGLVGSGSLLAVNRWYADDHGVVTRAKLLRIRRGLKTIKAGTDTVVARSADAGDIAVARPSGEVAVYSQAGTVLATVTPGSFRDVALSGKKLLVLTQAKVLDVYSIATGHLLHAWPVKGAWRTRERLRSPSRLDAYANIAVYSAKNKVYALRLATGKNVVLAQAPRTLMPVVGTTPRLQIGKPGVVYAYDTFNRKSLKIYGHVVFMPMKTVRTALAR